jgi:hypothetical protein
MAISPQVQLVLTRDSSVGRIRVDMESFFAFSFDLTEQLQTLVEDWHEFAAPAAQPVPIIHDVRFRRRS